MFLPPLVTDKTCKELKFESRPEGREDREWPESLQFKLVKSYAKKLKKKI